MCVVNFNVSLYVFASGILLYVHVTCMCRTLDRWALHGREQQGPEPVSPSSVQAQENTMRPRGFDCGLRPTHVCIGTNTLSRCVIQICEKNRSEI